MPNHVLRFAQVNFRQDRRVFGIKREDRFSHVYVIGKTGTGKSTLLETMALQDLALGNGFALIDPHGDLVERVAAQIPPSRRSQVIYLNAPDPEQPYGYNPLRHVRSDRIALATSGFLEAFKKLWPEAWGVRMEHILRNVLMALLELPDATMHDILRMLSDKGFRREVTRSLRNETVRTFLERIRALLVRVSGRRNGADPKQGRCFPRRPAAQSDPDRGARGPAYSANHG